MVLAPTLYGLDREELRKVVQEEGGPAYRASQILDWIYKKHIQSFEQAKNVPSELLHKIARRMALHALEFVEANASANGESSKFLFKTSEGRLIESVLITQQRRQTVCVSTQIGCKIGCAFCASGRGKFGRNLSAGEIVEQVAWIENKRGGEISNVVFMGMGEPLDNFEATMKALKILQAPWGFGLGARRITVSTSGITPKILEFVSRSEGRVRLSVSLHSAIESKRTELVPINKRYSLKELVAALGQIHKKLKREITFEYTVMEGINDSKQEAEEVAKIARPLRAKVNLIPYNPIREAEFKTPSRQKMEAFSGVLRKRGVRVTVRQTAGRDIDAACGQLRLIRENEKVTSH